MAKRNSVPRNADRVEAVDDRVEESFPLEVIDFDLPTPTVKQLVLQKDLVLKVVGPVTGETYVFNGAGSVVDVDERDVEFLLERISSTGCCGSFGSSTYFTLVGG